MNYPIGKCIYIYIHVCMCIYIYMYTCTHVYIFVYRQIYIYIYMYIHKYIFRFIHVYWSALGLDAFKLSWISVEKMGMFNQISFPLRLAYPFQSKYYWIFRVHLRWGNKTCENTAFEKQKWTGHTHDSLEKEVIWWEFWTSYLQTLTYIHIYICYDMYTYLQIYTYIYV